jgi:hypothetical protein
MLLLLLLMKMITMTIIAGNACAASTTNPSAVPRHCISRLLAAPTSCAGRERGTGMQAAEFL